MTTAEKTKSAGQALGSAADNYFAALKTGVKLQEEMADWWLGQCTKMNSVEGWSKPMQDSADAAVKRAQQSYDEAIGLIEKNSKEAMELMGKVGDMSQVGTVEEGRQKLEELWDASLDGIRKNAQLQVDANARLLQTYTEFIKKNTASKASATATK